MLHMYTGEKLGAALKTAMDLKKVKQKDVAAAFGIKQPSVSEWRAHGRISKEHIPLLVSWFSDVVGPEHWGLPAGWTTEKQGSDWPLSDDLLNALRRLRDVGSGLVLDAENAARKALSMPPVAHRPRSKNVLPFTRGAN